MEHSQEVISNIRDSWIKESDAFGRVYETVLGISEFESHNKIAEIAGCAPNTAKKHLKRLTQMGIVETNNSDNYLKFRRNDAYLEWREVTQIAKEHSHQELVERVQELEATEYELKDEFGVKGPDTASVYRSNSDFPTHELMQKIGKWNSIQRDIRIYEAARQLQQNDGRLISAFVERGDSNNIPPESQ